MIPFDQLYNFLDTVSNANLLIYRFLPAGSRNLDDCTPLHPYYTFKDWKTQVITPNIIFHDQEPLNWDQYTNIQDWVKQHHVHGPVAEIPYWNNRMIDYLADRNLAAVIHPVFASVYNSVLLAHSEQRSLQLSLYESNNFIGVYFWSHALIAQDWYRYAEIDPGLQFDSFDFDFVIYGRAWTGTREYRLKFFEELINAGLTNQSLAKFSQYDNDLNYKNHEFKNPGLKIQRCDLEQFLQSNSAESNSSATYNSNEYQNCAIDVVLETLYDDQRLHITEKLLRPIACGKPFIAMATPGSLEYLRSYGFKTFANVIDESYDVINDPVERLTAVINLMKDINSNPQKDELFKSMHRIAEYNKQYFHSIDFHNKVVNEYTQNLKQALIKVNSQRQAKDMNFWRREYENNVNTVAWLKEFDEKNARDLELIVQHVSQ